MAKKQKKSAGKPVQSPEEKIVDAAFALAAAQDWRFVTIRDIADEAGLTIDRFYDSFSGREDILRAYNHELDRKVLAAFSDYDPETPNRDRLFDMLMERFDLANQNRAPLLSIVAANRYDVKAVICGAPELALSMTKLLEASGFETGGCRGAARVLGLTFGYIYISKAWLDDETADLTQTMAAVDKVLNRFENIASAINL